jgi:hypothetical protein
MIWESKINKSISIALLAFSLLLLFGAGFKSYKVYDSGINAYGIPMFYRVSERKITIDATFHGVDRKSDGNLYTTYDRLADTGKRSCPT